MERFSLDIPLNDCANGLYAAMKAEVESRGGTLQMDNDTRSHILAAANWLINPHSTPGLLLCGLCGNGKTTLAKAIARLIQYTTEQEMGYSDRLSMRLYTAKQICRMCAAGEKFKEQYNEYNRLFQEQMLIIDDLGEEPQEVMVYGMIHTPIIDLIGERYATRKMTIITTNLEPKSIQAKYGERIRDRLRELLTSITFSNDSYRRAKADNPVDDKG